MIRTLIVTAETNDLDPQARLAEALAGVADHELLARARSLPWNRRPAPGRAARSVAAPSSAFTIARAAEILGEDEQPLCGIAAVALVGGWHQCGVQR